MKRILAAIILLVIATVFLLALFGCTIAGKTSNEGKFVEKANINTQATTQRVDDLEAPAATYQFDRIRVGKGGQLSVAFPEPKEPVRRSRRIAETISNNSKANSRASWLVTEVDGLYYLLIGFAVLLVAIASLAGMVAWRLGKAKGSIGLSEFASTIEGMALNGVKHFTAKTPEWFFSEKVGDAVKIAKAKLRIK
jgi:hypothetical protein